jgi:uncharacterized membrane protein YkvA (DUF1232 family)
VRRQPEGSAVKVSFELTNKDIRYFKKHLERVRKSVSDEKLVIQGAVGLVAAALESDLPDFVRVRMHKLQRMIDMLKDAAWRLEGKDRARILDALAYFVDPDDLIPDKVPGIGYLDDAIMVELVVQELRHEIDAYEDFCKFRKQKVRPKQEQGDLIEKRRTALQGRMRRRRRRDRASRSGGRSRSPIRLW